MRLVGGESDNEGTVEVCVGAEWTGVLCDQDWDNGDATVICNQLGYLGEGTTCMAAIVSKVTASTLPPSVWYLYFQERYLFAVGSSWTLEMLGLGSTRFSVWGMRLSSQPVSTLLLTPPTALLQASSVHVSGCQGVCDAFTHTHTHIHTLSLTHTHSGEY